VKGLFPRSSHSCWEDQADSTVGYHRTTISLDVSGGPASCVVLRWNDINLSQQTLLASSTQESSCLSASPPVQTFTFPSFFECYGDSGEILPGSFDIIHVSYPTSHRRQPLGHAWIDVHKSWQECFEWTANCDAADGFPLFVTANRLSLGLWI
jgi:hypothetical protein